MRADLSSIRQSGLSLMPCVRFIAERRIRYEPSRGWAWEQIGDYFCTPADAKRAAAALHLPLGDTRTRPVVLR